MKFSTFWTYLKYVLKHKHGVLQAGLKLNVSIWQLLKHDLSKFSPFEFIPYAIWFNERPAEMYWIDYHQAELNFHQAWLHHIHKNPHHWQHWVLRMDEGGVEVLRMPEKYVREMVADWHGVGIALGKGSENGKVWYEKNKHTMALHEQTRNRVEALLGVTEPYSNVSVVPHPKFREIGAD